MFGNAGGEERELLSIFLVVLPAALYILGLAGGNNGRRFFFAGLLVHAAGIALRGLELGALPLSEKHDNISFMAFATAIIYLFSRRGRDVPDFSAAALPLISVSLLVSLAYEPVNTVSPFMDSPWFYLHIFLYFVSYAFFGIASSVGVFSLLPGNAGLETELYRAASIGWILLTMSLVAGSLWFFVAYGTYWLWTSRELWTTLTWFFYGLYLHARLMKGLRGRPAAILGVLGFGIALFTYFGVGTIIPAPPTQY